MTYVQYVHFYLKVFITEKYEDNTEKLLYTSVENAFKLKVTYCLLFPIKNTQILEKKKYCEN